MARETDMGGDNNDLFVGEDKIFEHYVVDENGVPVNMTTWVSMKFTVRKADGSADPAIFDKAASLQGVYDANPLANTQRWVVILTDTEMNTVKAIPYRYSWKRQDDTVETVTGFGYFTPKLVTNR